MNSTEQVARRYYDAWASGDRHTVTTLLAPTFRFAAGDLRIDGREAFLASGAFPRDATVTMIAEAYQDEVAFQLYDATRGDRTIRVAEQLTVRNGLIASSNFVTDMAAFAAFAGGGRPPMTRNPEVDRWLQQAGHPLEATMRRARDIILGADGRVTESIKWKTPTFAYRGNIASFNPSKHLLSIMFHRGAEIPGAHPRLEGDGRLVRTMRFADLAELEAGRADLEAVVRAWCDWKAASATRR
jgi:hypothetical protein